MCVFGVLLQRDPTHLKPTVYTNQTLSKPDKSRPSVCLNTSMMLLRSWFSNCFVTFFKKSLYVKLNTDFTEGKSSQGSRASIKGYLEKWCTWCCGHRLALETSTLRRGRLWFCVLLSLSYFPYTYRLLISCFLKPAHNLAIFFSTTNYVICLFFHPKLHASTVTHKLSNQKSFTCRFNITNHKFAVLTGRHHTLI